MLLRRHTQSRSVRKMLKLVEQYRLTIYESYTKHVLQRCPIDDITVTLPTKRTMLKLIKAELNPDNNSTLNLLIHQFIDEKYSKLGVK